jgi:hypothetical protein
LLRAPSPSVRVVSFRAFPGLAPGTDRPVAAEALRIVAASERELFVLTSRRGASALERGGWNGE